MMKDYVI